MEDYLTYWLEKVYKPTVYVTTYVRLRPCVFKHLIPALGHIHLRKLTAHQVQVLYSGKAEEGLAPATVKGIYGILHAALDYAVKCKLVSQNVCEWGGAS